MAFQTLFGSEVPEVVRHDGTTLSVSKLGGAHHKFVILYFSAHWCPPCKRFTPILAEFYKLLKATRDDVEIVFLSSDKSEEEFKEYFETMPWYAMPYQARRTKTKLSGKFKVEGIPTLLVLTGDGEVINKDAMSSVYEARDNLNAALESFPWKPKTMGEILSSNPVITAKDGSAVNLSSLSSFALYFSAHWCPPCRGFTPKLAERYESLQRLHPNTQIVFVSSDNTEEEFDAYYASMPWAALAFADRATKEALSELCEVSSIPSLVTIDGATLQIINTNGREASDEDEAGTNFPWLPTPLPLVAELGMKADVVEALNARVCYFLSIPEDAEGVSSTTAEEIIAAFKAAAPLVDAKRGDDDVLKVSFFTVPSSGLELLERVMAVSKPENVEGVYKVQPLVLATLLGPSKQAAVLTKDLTVASNIVDFAHQFYVKAAEEGEV